MSYPWTVQQLKDNFGLDVFGETIKKLSFPDRPEVITELYNLAWARYRNRSIGDYDRDYWLSMLNDRVLSIWSWYKNIASEIYSSSIAVIQSGSTSETSTSTGSGTSTVHNESEDRPDIEAGTKKYLSARSDQSGTSGQTASASGSSTRLDGPKAKVANEVMDELKTLNQAFVRELDSMFMNRW
jgi:hypothetical protein